MNVMNTIVLLSLVWLVWGLEDQYLVLLRRGLGEDEVSDHLAAVNELMTKYKTFRGVQDHYKNANAYSAHLPSDLISTIRNRPDVAHLEPDFVIRAHIIPRPENVHTIRSANILRKRRFDENHIQSDVRQGLSRICHKKWDDATRYDHYLYLTQVSVQRILNLPAASHSGRRSEVMQIRTIRSDMGRTPWASHSVKHSA